MNSTGHNGEKMGYRVILLLVVGLTAFSSAMKELNQVQQFSLDASRLISHWSDTIAPTEIPQTAVKVETCQLKQSPPSVDLPWLTSVADEETTAPASPVLTNHTKPAPVQIARLKKLRRIDIDPVQFEVRLPVEHDAATDDDTISSELPLSLFKAKTRRHGIIRISTRDREMLLKTLNRSISLRIAS